MADLVLRYGADTKGVMRAQRDLVRSSRTTAAEVGRLGKNVDETFRTFVSAEAAKQAVMRSVSLATEAAKQSDTLRDNFGRVSKSVEEFKGRLGDDLAVTFFDDNGATAAGLDLLSKGRDVASSFYGGVLKAGGAWKDLMRSLGDTDASDAALDRFKNAFRDSFEVTRQLRLQREQEQFNRGRGEQRLASRAAPVTRAGATGDTFGARAAQIELDREREQQRLNASTATRSQITRQERELGELTSLRLAANERDRALAVERLGLERQLARAAATAADDDDRAAARSLAVFDARVKAAQRVRALGLGDAVAGERGDEAARLTGRAFDVQDRLRADAAGEQAARDRERRERERQWFRDRLTQARSRRLRATGQGDQADRLDAELGVRQAVTDAQRSGVFTAAELLDYEKQLRQEVEGRLSAEKQVNRERDRFRTLSPGSPELAAATFGRGARSDGGRDAIGVAQDRRREVRESRLASLAVGRGDAVAIGDDATRLREGGREARQVADAVAGGRAVRIDDTAARTDAAMRAIDLGQIARSVLQGGPVRTDAPGQLFRPPGYTRADAIGLANSVEVAGGRPGGQAVGGFTAQQAQRVLTVIENLERRATGEGLNINTEGI